MKPWFSGLVQSNCEATVTPQYLLHKTQFVCIEPEEPSCKFLWGMPPAAASQKGLQCKTSEVTLFGPKQSVRKEGHVRIQSSATTEPITFKCWPNKKTRVQPWPKQLVGSGTGCEKYKIYVVLSFCCNGVQSLGNSQLTSAVEKVGKTGKLHETNDYDEKQEAKRGLPQTHRLRFIST